MRFSTRVLIGGIALGVASWVVPGITLASPWTLLFAAILFGIANAVVKPIAVILTLPITLVSFGLFLIVINAGMLALVAWLLPGFAIRDFGSAVLGALAVSFVSWLASFRVAPDGRVEVIRIEDRPRV